MKRFSSTLCIGFLAMIPALALLAEETALSPCGKGFTIQGEITHLKKPDNLVIAGGENSDRYAEAIHGKSFTALVPGLPEGNYTIEIELSETVCHVSGERVMDIACGNTKIAENLDLITSAGFAKAFQVKGTLHHADDSVDGPLSIQFTGKTGDAMFNAISILPAGSNDAVACVKAMDLGPLRDEVADLIPAIKEAPIYLDPDQPTDQRVADLVRRMSLREKVGQLMDNAPAIPRLSVPSYDYWNECLHGVARTGTATVFPQAIGLAATWDPALLQNVADSIATEARAKNNETRAHGNGNTARYFGLTFWTPNINIFRDPRWGRGQETYGEDPFLTAQLGVAFIRGLQGDDPHYYKVLACAKHFAVHSGPEKLRQAFNVDPDPRDLYETYLPQFEAAVRDAKVGCVMSAYNALDGVPASANKFLLTDLLRDQWGFKGYVVSDCGAVSNIWTQHHYTKTKEEGSALALKAGCDLECGSGFTGLVGAVDQKLLTEQDIDTALARVLEGRFRLGLFDPADRVPFSKIPPAENDSPAHSALALQAAHEAIVLLKNDGVLPLDKTKLKHLAVIGPNADSKEMLVGNYHGTPSHPVTILQGIRDAVGSDVEVAYAKGCPLALKPGESFDASSPDFKDALHAAASADVVIFVSGLDEHLEGEQMKTDFVGFDGGDRVRIELPAPQADLIKALQKTGKPVVLVNCTGSAVAMPWEAEHLSAIVQAWYPGENGGTAVADILLGHDNPSGRLPITFYRATEDLPNFTDYRMANRTYRYFTGKPVFPFGHGLSYTQFDYGPLKTPATTVTPDGKVTISLEVKNTGGRDGDEIVQLYMRRLDSTVPQPIHALAAFRRVSIVKGATATVELDFPASALRYWDEKAKSYFVPPGAFEIQVGASSTDIRSTVQMQLAKSS